LGYFEAGFHSRPFCYVHLDPDFRALLGHSNINQDRRIEDLTNFGKLTNGAGLQNPVT
jgi:hypothetical protein